MRLRFIMGEVWNGLRRNGSMAISVILVTFVSLTFVGAAVLIQTQVDQLRADWYGRVEVSVFLCPENSIYDQCGQGAVTPVQEAAILRVLTEGTVGELVESVYYESREEALANFINNDDDATRALAQGLTADQMQPIFRVKLYNPEQFEVIQDAVAGLQGVESVFDQRKVFSGLFSFLRAATLVAAALAAIMLVAAVLLITTTIRLSAMSRRRETTIMRMVGSSRTLIQLPFMLEGAIAATIGALLAVGGLFFSMQYLVEDWLRSSFPWVNRVDSADVLSMAPWLLAIAVGLSALASVVTIGRYTRA